jgi:hypothetical protein
VFFLTVLQRVGGAVVAMSGSCDLLGRCAEVDDDAAARIAHSDALLQDDRGAVGTVSGGDPAEHRAGHSAQRGGCLDRIPELELQ